MAPTAPTASPRRLDVYRTALPMRRFEHAAASRDVAEAVVVRLELADGAVGWGETLPREYVTGETIDSVVEDLAATVWPAFVANHAGLAGEAARVDATVPSRDAAGRCLNAAACALDVAAAPLVSEPFRGEQAGAPIGCRVSGVLGSSDPARTAGQLRRMRWFGLRDFKLKLGFGEDVDAENVGILRRRLGRALAAGKATLRVDVNGGWDADSTPERVAALRAAGVCAVEQPVYAPAGELVELARRCELPLIADESLLDDEDARRLLDEPRRVWWNIRISKNGGLTQALGLAGQAHEAGAAFIVGCMVGESSVLSAAQRRLLQVCPRPRFVEGNYGRFLLAGDLTRRSLRFGYGGRLRAIRRPGLGAEVDEARLARHGRLVRTLRA